MTDRKEQKRQRRKSILNSALDLFIRKGYGETKIADIAKAADMSIGLLFHYFDSKEKLYEELVKIGYEFLNADLPVNEVSPIITFRLAAENIFNMTASDPSAAKMFVFMENAQHLDILSSEVKEMLSEANQLIQKSVPIIRKGQILGEIRQGDPEALSLAFWCSIQGIVQHLAFNPKIMLPQVDWIMQILEVKE